MSVARCSAFGDVAHSGQSLEVSVMGPELSACTQCRRINEAIGQGEFELGAELGGVQCKRGIQRNDFTLLHDGDTGDGVVFVALRGDAFENFEQCDGRHHEGAGPFDDGCEWLCARPIREVFESS